MESPISVGMLSSLFLEGIKLLWRKLIAKDMTFDFPTWFYAVSIPLLNAVMPFVLVWLGLVSDDPILSMTLPEVARYLVVVLLGSLISLVTYGAGIKPLKEYAKEQAA